MSHQVTLLKSAKGQVLSIYADRSDAETKRDKYNADPHLDSETPDPDAPYEIETWIVQ